MQLLLSHSGLRPGIASWTNYEGLNNFNIFQACRGLRAKHGVTHWWGLQGILNHAALCSAVQNDDKTNPLRDTPHPDLPQVGEGAKSNPGAGDSVSNLDYSGGRKTHRFPPPYGLGSLSLTHRPTENPIGVTHWQELQGILNHVTLCCAVQKDKKKETFTGNSPSRPSQISGRSLLSL